VEHCRRCHCVLDDLVKKVHIGRNTFDLKLTIKTTLDEMQAFIAVVDAGAVFSQAYAEDESAYQCGVLPQYGFVGADFHVCTLFERVLGGWVGWVELNRRG